MFLSASCSLLVSCNQRSSQTSRASESEGDKCRTEVVVSYTWTTWLCFWRGHKKPCIEVWFMLNFLRSYVKQYLAYLEVTQMWVFNSDNLFLHILHISCDSLKHVSIYQTVISYIKLTCRFSAMQETLIIFYSLHGHIKVHIEMIMTCLRW